MDALKPITSSLEWNKYMTFGTTLWAFLVGIVVVNSEAKRICTETNPFPGAIFIVGLVFAVLFPCLELFTDITEYKKTSIRLIRKTNLKNIAQQRAKDLSLDGVVLRFFANLLVFYLAVGITSFGWFDDNETCFIPFPITARMWTLIAVAIVEVILLSLRVGLFDYTEKPKKPAAVNNV